MEDGSGAEGVRQELATVQERMEQVRKETQAEVEAKWTSQWRNPDLVNLKTESWLSGNAEFRTLIARARELEAQLTADGAEG